MKKQPKFKKLSPDLEEVPNAELHTLKGGTQQIDDQVYPPTGSIPPDDEQLLIYGSSTETWDEQNEEWDLEALKSEEWDEEEWDIQAFGEGGEGEWGDGEEDGEGDEGGGGEEGWEEGGDEPNEEPDEGGEEPSEEPAEEPSEDPEEEPNEEPAEEPNEGWEDEDPNEELELTEEELEELEELEEEYRDWMTDAEKAIFDKMRPLQRLAYLRNGYTALTRAEQLFPNMSQHNTQADAFRHAYFSLLNVAELGLTLATQLGNAHEEGTDQTDIEITMDLGNNEVGRNAYVPCPTGVPFMSFYSSIAYNLVTSGSLKYINDGELIPTNQ